MCSIIRVTEEVQSTQLASLAPSWHAASTPGRPAIVMGSNGVTVTYAELEERSRRFAGALRARGLKVGDHLAILMDNSHTFLEVAWAAQRAGLYYTPINNHLRPGQVQYVLDDCGASALVSSRALADVIARLDTSRVPVRISADGNLAGFEHFDDVVAAQTGAPVGDECEGREMLYSSGTTGRPKGVRKLLPGTMFGDPSSVVAQIADGLTAGHGTDPVYLCPAPLYHSAPLVGSMSWHRVGGTVVLMEKFDAGECLRLIERYRVTDAQFVPTMFVRLLRLPRAERERYDLSSLRTVLHTAAPCSVAVKRQMLEWWGPIIHEYYSGTEDLGATYISAQEWLAHPGSVGRPIDECHIVGPDGKELSPGQVGVVYFAGGRRFEYHGDPDKTASVTHGKGWRTLGDMGYLDSDGYLYLTDRVAHMIISGGVNIYPQEIENVLIAHPGSVGKPTTECHIVGEDGSELGPGEAGLVYFAGGRPFEYHNDPAKTATIMNERGWRTLGDIGYLDADGYLYLTDRQAHMIISGGVNIYPQEAENVLAGHQAVADVAVIGVPDDEMGEAVKAVVQLAEGVEWTPHLEQELLDFCRERLARFKCPRSIDAVDTLPRTPTGKLLTHVLRRSFLEASGAVQ